MRFEREIMLAAGLPYVYVTMRVVYPRTPDRGYDRGKAQRLQQAWDNDWQEIMPCEINPALAGNRREPAARVEAQLLRSRQQLQSRLRALLEER